MNNMQRQQLFLVIVDMMNVLVQQQQMMFTRRHQSVGRICVTKMVPVDQSLGSVDQSLGSVDIIVDQFAVSCFLVSRQVSFLECLRGYITIPLLGCFGSHKMFFSYYSNY